MNTIHQNAARWPWARLCHNACSLPVNSNRKKDDLDKRLIVDNKQQLVTKEPPDWDVRGSPMIQDGIEAVKWAVGMDPHQARTREGGHQVLRLVHHISTQKCNETSASQDPAGDVLLGHRHVYETVRNFRRRRRRGPYHC